MTDIVYILTNEAMSVLVKIGYHQGDYLSGRIRPLYGSGVPLPIKLFYASEVTNAAFVETQLHDAFSDHRVSKKREFFRIAPERVKAALSITAIREVELGDEIFESAEVKAEVDTARRRTRFQFSMIGKDSGTELQLENDPNIFCRTVDEKNKVEFRGDLTSFSDAALQAIREIGDEWPTASGPWEWTYQNKRLDEIRREIEEMAELPR